MKQILIFGCTERSEMLLQYLVEEIELEVIAITDWAEQKLDSTAGSKEGLCRADLPHLAWEIAQKRYPPDKYALIIAPSGSIPEDKHPGDRAERFHEARRLGYQCLSYIHPSNTISPSANIADSCIILENNTIQAHADVGENTTILCNNVIAHHSRIGAHSTITSGTVVAGHASVGEHCFLGPSAVILNERQLGDFGVLGPQASLVSSVDKYARVNLAPQEILVDRSKSANL